MKRQALLITLLTGITLTAAAADRTVQSPADQAPVSRQAPIQLSADQMDQIVAGGYGPGTGDCTGTGVPKLDGTGPKYGKK